MNIAGGTGYSLGNVETWQFPDKVDKATLGVLAAEEEDESLPRRLAASGCG